MNSFVMYRSWVEAIEKMNGDQTKAFVLAVANYAMDGIEPELSDPMVDVVFGVAKPVLDKSIKRYQNCVENGKRGGRPKKETLPIEIPEEIPKPKPTVKPKAKPKKEDTLNAQANEVIDYLNEKADKHYRHLESSQKWVRARLNEGFTVDDCKKVVDNKVAEWKGDSKMDGYLRPETLFGNKFDNYLNSKGNGRRSQIVPDYMVKDTGETRSDTTADEIENMLKGMKR